MLRAMTDGEAAPASSPLGPNEAQHVIEFALHEGDRWRYDHGRRTWFVYEAPVWRQDRDGGIVRAITGFTQFRLQAAAALHRREDRDQMLKFYERQLRAGQIDRLERFAQAQRPFAVTGDEWDQHRLLLACANGVVDFETMNLRDAESGEHLTRRAAVPYDPCATAPTWSRFVLEICNGDEALAGFLRRSIGYAATGETTEQVFWLLVGGGSNGKSTFLEQIMAVLPDHSWAMSFPSHGWTEAIGEYQRASLVGRRLVVAKESEQARRLNVEFIKGFTGGDTVNARHPYGKPFVYKPEGKLFLAANHRPIIRDDSHGIWRRVRLVPFLRTFPVDTEFPRKLAAEAEGILAWIVRGAFEWLRHGLQAPTSVLAATTEYQHESDPLTPFLDERCVIADYAQVRASVLFSAYLRWCDDRQVPQTDRLSQREFGPRIRRDFTATDGRQVTYQGIGLQESHA